MNAATRLAPDYGEEFIMRDCPTCDGEGVARYCTHFDRDGNECGYTDTCPTCRGTGEVEEETQPVECDDDIEAIDAWQTEVCGRVSA